MAQVYNTRRNEGCRLENDDQDVMVLGAVWRPEAQERGALGRPRRSRESTVCRVPSRSRGRSSLRPRSTSKGIVLGDDLCFRAPVGLDKSQLRHAEFGQTHESRSRR